MTLKHGNKRTDSETPSTSLFDMGQQTSRLIIVSLLMQKYKKNKRQSFTFTSLSLMNRLQI